MHCRVGEGRNSMPKSRDNKAPIKVPERFMRGKGDVEIRLPGKKPEKGERLDESGHAYAGSQRQLQNYVNLRPLEFAEKVLASLSLPPFPSSTIRWVSPLASDGYKEYRDEDFLCALDLHHLCGALRDFWPQGGPCWDALGIVDTPSGRGPLLVEAKSHVSELQSECKAEAVSSMKRIRAALEETKKWLRIPNPDHFDWLKPYYQTANRYAHLCFLRSRGIQAWLANVYFLKDPHFKDSPQKREQWSVAIENVERSLGVTGKGIPYSAKLILEASCCY